MPMSVRVCKPSLLPSYIECLLDLIEQHTVLPGKPVFRLIDHVIRFAAK